jgi:DNA-binding CsgD family transcriptional regulator
VSTLTARQVQVLRLIQQGLTRREIAERLGITTSAVDWHLHRVYIRLGVSSRIGAVLKAANLGLLESVCPGCKELRAENRELRRQISRQNNAIELLDDLDEMQHEGAHA